MAKLSQSDIKALAERWAIRTKKIAALEKERDAELHPYQVAFEKKTAPITAKYDAEIDKLQDQADKLELQITEWLESQTRSISLESKSAVAEFSKGTAEGNREVDAEKFVDRCVQRKIKDFWKYVKVTIKDAQLVMGKEDMDELCTKQKVPYATASLTLKN